MSEGHEGTWVPSSADGVDSPVERTGRMAALVEELPVGVFRTSERGEILAANGALLSLCGADSREELFGKSAVDLYERPEDRESVRVAMAEEGAVHEREIELRGLDGETVWVEMTAVRRETGDGRVHFEGIVQDITERRCVERDLAETRIQLEEIAENSPDALWMFSADFEELLFINDAYEDLWGRPVSELEDDPTEFLSSVHPEDVGRVRNAMERLGRGDAVDIEYRIEHPERSTRWMWSKGSPVSDADGTVYRIAGFTRDITDRRRHEEELAEYRGQLEATVEELERSNEELEQFAYVASHDLQEPLRMVSSYVDLLAEEYGDRLDEEAGEYVHYAVDGANRMREMIDGLLRYSRVNTREMEIEPVDAGAVLEETLRDLELRIEDADATVTRDALPTVEVDASLLGQLFQNLVRNALVHGGESPRIHVSATEVDEGAVISVEDDGEGIPPDRQEDVFEVFNRASHTTEGTGIGLAICRRIVKRYGGEIWVESEPGDGATFRFTIPLPGEDENGGRAGPPEDENGGRAGSPEEVSTS